MNLVSCFRPRMIPDQADPTPLGCDSGYAAKRARPASAGQAAPLGVLVTVTRAPKFDGRRPTGVAPDALDCRAAAPSTFGREHLVGLDGQSSVSAAGLLRLDRPLPPTRQSWIAPAPSGRRTNRWVRMEPTGTRSGRSPERVERRTIQPPGKPMSVIAQAIADRQSEIERLQVEIDQGVERSRQDPRDLRPAGEARGSALLLAADGGCGHPGRGDPARRQADEEAPYDVGRREECGVRADDRLLGRAQKESREVARLRRAGGYVPHPAGGGSPDEPPREVNRSPLIRPNAAPN